MSWFSQASQYPTHGPPSDPYGRSFPQQNPYGTSTPPPAYNTPMAPQYGYGGYANNNQTYGQNNQYGYTTNNTGYGSPNAWSNNNINTTYPPPLQQQPQQASTSWTPHPTTTSSNNSSSYTSFSPHFSQDATPAFPASAPSFQGPTASTSSSSGSRHNSWAWELFKQIDPGMLQTMKQWFEAVDTDHSGQISADELGQLPLSGRPLGRETASMLIKIFDKNGSGELNFEEYAALHQFLLKMQTAFIDADASKTGFLNANEIAKGLQDSGFQLSLQTVQSICSKADYIPNKGLSFDSFVKVCAQLAIVRSIFEWNDKEKKGSVTLNYDQLAHISIFLL